MKTRSFIALFIISGAIWPSCMKKGENDPGISLRSRKARVVGEWKMTSFNSTTTGPSGNTTFTSDGSTYTEKSGSMTTTGTLSEEVTFEKDGTYKWVTVMDGQSGTEEGVWNFTGCIGDLKKKEQITLYEQRTSFGGVTNTSTGHYFDDTWDLDELRHKKLVAKRSYSETSLSGTTTHETEYVFEAK